MLVLDRRLNQMVTMQWPDGSIAVIKIVRITGDKVRMGFSAPRDVRILRNELIEETPREDETPLVNPDWVKGAQEERRTKR